MPEEKKFYSYDADTVFESLKNVCSKSWFTVISVDESIRRIIMSTPPSLFSYGESIEAIVQSEGNNKALVYLKSKPKVFFNITARGAVERNIQKIYQMLDEALR